MWHTEASKRSPTGSRCGMKMILDDGELSNMQDDARLELERPSHRAVVGNFGRPAARPGAYN